MNPDEPKSLLRNPQAVLSQLRRRHHLLLFILSEWLMQGLLASLNLLANDPRLGKEFSLTDRK